MTDKLTELNLKEIYDLSKKVLKFNGCNEENANYISYTKYILQSVEYKI